MFSDVNPGGRRWEYLGKGISGEHTENVLHNLDVTGITNEELTLLYGVDPIWRY